MTPQPFSNFIELLAARRLPSGYREQASLSRLLDRFDGTDVEQLSEAVGALFGRNESEADLVRDLFLQRYRREPEVVEFPLPPARQERNLRATVIVVTLLLIATTQWVLRRTSPPLQPPPQGSVAPPDSAIPQSVASRPRPERPKDPKPGSRRLPHSKEQLVWLTTLVSLVGLGLASALYVARRRSQARRYWDQQSLEQLDALPDPREPPIEPITPPGWPTELLDDAAALLSRSAQVVSRRSQIDIRASLAATLRSGGVPTVRYRRARKRPRYLILVDEAPSSAPYAPRIEALLHGLEVRGVLFDRYGFDSVPSQLRTRWQGCSLSQLATAGSSSPLIIIGDGMDLFEPNGAFQASVRDLRRFANRILWRPSRTGRAVSEIWRSELSAFPLTRNGLLRGAAAVSFGDASRSGVGEEPLPRGPLRREIDQLAGLAAFAPYARVPLLEAIRRDFLPESPQDTTALLLARQGDATNQRIVWNDDAREHLVRGLVINEPERARAISGYLSSAIVASEPQRGSAAHLRWLLLKYRHILENPATADDADQAIGSLAALANSPLRLEALSCLDRASESALTGNVIARQRAIAVADRARNRPIDSAQLPLHPGAREITVLLLIGLLGVGSLPLLPRRQIVVENVQNAYLIRPLAEDGAELTVRRLDTGRPNTCELHDNDRSRDTIGLKKCDERIRVKLEQWYQCRTLLDDGNWALSNWYFATGSTASPAETSAPIDNPAPPPPTPPLPEVPKLKPSLAADCAHVIQAMHKRPAPAASYPNADSTEADFEKFADMATAIARRLGAVAVATPRARQSLAQLSSLLVEEAAFYRASAAPEKRPNANDFMRAQVAFTKRGEALADWCDPGEPPPQPAKPPRPPPPPPPPPPPAPTTSIGGGVVASESPEALGRAGSPPVEPSLETVALLASPERSCPGEIVRIAWQSSASPAQPEETKQGALRLHWEPAIPGNAVLGVTAMNAGEATIEREGSITINPQSTTRVTLYRIGSGILGESAILVGPCRTLLSDGFRALQNDVSKFVLTMKNNAGQPYGSYEANRSRYARFGERLSALEKQISAAALPSGAAPILTGMSEELRSNMTRLESLHRDQGERGLNAKVAESALVAINIQFESVLQVLYEAELPPSARPVAAPAPAAATPPKGTAP